MDGTSKVKKRIECRIRHMIVRYFASEWCTNSLFQKEKIYRKGSFSIFPQSVPASQNHCHLHVGVDNTVGIKLLRWYRFSGGEMTGKFRKVASHSAPDPAFGLFLNLPEGTSPLCSGPHRANVHWTLCAPLEPRHVNSVNIPAKCPTDIPTEHLLIDEDLSPLPLRSVQSWRPLDVMHPAPV